MEGIQTYQEDEGNPFASLRYGMGLLDHDR